MSAFPTLMPTLALSPVIPGSPSGEAAPAEGALGFAEALAALLQPTPAATTPLPPAGEAEATAVQAGGGGTTAGPIVCPDPTAPTTGQPTTWVSLTRPNGGPLTSTPLLPTEPTTGATTPSSPPTGPIVCIDPEAPQPTGGPVAWATETPREPSRQLAASEPPLKAAPSADRPQTASVPLPTPGSATPAMSRPAPTSTGAPIDDVAATPGHPAKPVVHDELAQATPSDALVRGAMAAPRHASPALAAVLTAAQTLAASPEAAEPEPAADVPPPSVPSVAAAPDAKPPAKGRATARSDPHPAATAAGPDVFGKAGAATADLDTPAAVLPIAARDAGALPEIEPAAAELDAPAPVVAAAPAVSTPTELRADSAPVVRATSETAAGLAAEIARKLEGRTTRFEVALTPEGLGGVNVSIEIGRDGALSAAFAFERPQAAAELTARAGELRQALQQAGFDLSQSAFSFDGRHEGSGADRQLRSPSQAYAARLDDLAAADLPPLPISGRTARAGGLDLRV